VDEVLAKLTAGDDFDALMETYGEDPGMKNSPQKENGYAVCQDFASFDPAFTDAAMALANVGDVSPAVRGQNGIHIIKYASDIPEGAAKLETVKEDISAGLLSTRQDEAYTTQVDEWVTQSDVKIYKDRMNQ
jgi:parvulin-like peptidyl-prolyl isomerase